jgi:hypothetical protein
LNEKINDLTRNKNMSVSMKSRAVIFENSVKDKLLKAEEYSIKMREIESLYTEFKKIQMFHYNKYQDFDKTYFSISEIEVNVDTTIKKAKEAYDRVMAFKQDQSLSSVEIEDINQKYKHVEECASQLEEFAEANNMPDIENISQSLSGEAAKTKFLLTLS